LKQVLLNLFLNAVQAMEGFTDKPRLKVKLREIRPKPLFPFAQSLPLYKIWEGWEAGVGPVERPFLEIDVMDNGVGISSEDMSRIFVPFFTTKPRGTGLGLAICQRFVQGMGGTIHVKPNKPQGTVFTVHLPLRREEGNEWLEAHDRSSLEGVIA
jgi:two-component system sensor histidine kinase HydH